MVRCDGKMWKYVSRRIKDTFERGAGYFDARSAATAGVSRGEAPERPAPAVPCRWRRERRCWSGRARGEDPNRNWYFSYLNQSWLGAITWSSALALGWYATQLIHVKKKYHSRERSALCHILHRNFSTVQLFCAKPLHALDDKRVVRNGALQKFESAEETRRLLPVQLISNDRSDGGASTSGSASSASSHDLSDILNSIENKLGLAAIENGQHRDGLSMLRSAANRHHPPALYNLGLCYELGLGVKTDEKMAMELYRVAATLEHPGALYNLAVYYGQGRGGLSRDSDTATRLLRLAALKGQTDAIDALKTLEEPPTDRVNPEDTWLKLERENWAMKYDGNKTDIVPSQTSLFVEQIKAFSNDLRCEAAVY